MPGFSIVNFSGKSVVGKLLLEKISSAIGRHFDPSQNVRMAKSKAQADRTLRVSAAETDIEIAELRQRATDRFVNEEMTKQVNIESITQKALPHLADDASPDGMEDDWITNFFDKCRTASDDEMQQAWARILAGEANSPGSFARKTVNLMADLDKRDAELFTNLCRFVWTFGGRGEPLVFDTNEIIYNKHQITFDSIGHLESLGLVQYGGNSGFLLTGFLKKGLAAYHKKEIVLTFPKDVQNNLEVGRVFFSSAGRQLSTICRPEPDEDFFYYVYDRWAGESLVPPQNVQQDA